MEPDPVLGENGTVNTPRPSDRLSQLFRALRNSADDPAVVDVADAFGSEPETVHERAVGEPARHVRRLLFASGGEIILHDGVVAAVVLHVEEGQRHVRLTDWIGEGNRATLDELETAFAKKPSFAGFRTPYFKFDSGFAKAVFGANGWKEPGGLLRLTLMAEQPGLVPEPDDDGCPGCSGLLQRGTSGVVDVDATVTALTTATADGQLKEDVYWVRVGDLLALHASGLMERVESQLRCKSCGRTVCFTLFRDGEPEFRYCSFDQARRRPLESIPPVQEWGDPARIAEAEQGMQYVNHEPGSWFLVRKGEELYLDARYSAGALIDSSALIHLDESELAEYRTHGPAYLSRLTGQIHESAPYQDGSPYYARDLYRRPDGSQPRKDVSAAIVNHTWIAQQRQK